MFLAMIIETVDELLSSMLHEVLGQGQVTDGLVRLLTEVEQALVPQLGHDGLLRLGQRPHGIDQVEREERLQPKRRRVVLLEYAVPLLAFGNAQICHSLFPSGFGSRLEVDIVHQLPRLIHMIFPRPHHCATRWMMTKTEHYSSPKVSCPCI